MFYRISKRKYIVKLLKNKKNIIKYTCENNSRKIGKYTPGSHIKKLINQYLKKILIIVYYSLGIMQIFFKTRYKKKGECL